MDGYTLKVSALAAAVTHSSIKDVRKYLNGVFLDFPNGRIVATDGHRMFVGAIERADEPAVIVDRDQILSALKSAKTCKSVEAMYVNVRPDPNDAENNPRRVELVTVGARYEGASLEGRFPEYERVIPTLKDDETPGSYNAAYVLDAQKALAIYGGWDPKRAAYWIHQRGPNNACLIVGRECLVVIMPIRADQPEPSDLEWYTGTPAPVAEEPAPIAEAA